MENELTFLIKLQDYDNRIADLTGLAKEKDEFIAKQNALIRKTEGALQEAKSQLTANQVKKKELDNAAESKESLIKKHQGELNSLKSNEAYKAMLGEIQTAKTELSRIEDDILGLMERIDQDQKNFKDTEAKKKNEIKAAQEEIHRYESEKKDLQSQAEKIKTERTGYAKTVPSDLLSRYEAIRGKRGEVAIVPVVGNSCGGCNMGLPPNKVNEVKKAKSMVVCENCSRILFISKEEKEQTTSPS